MMAIRGHLSCYCDSSCFFILFNCSSLETLWKLIKLFRFLARLFFEEKKSNNCHSLGVVVNVLIVLGGGVAVQKLKPWPITHKPFKIIKWNLVHMLPETICTCKARAWTLTTIFIELCPFFDLEITDERWRSLRIALVVNVRLYTQSGKCSSLQKAYFFKTNVWIHEELIIQHCPINFIL